MKPWVLSQALWCTPEIPGFRDRDKIKVILSYMVRHRDTHRDRHTQIHTEEYRHTDIDTDTYTGTHRHTHTKTDRYTHTYYTKANNSQEY